MTTSVAHARRSGALLVSGLAAALAPGCADAPSFTVSWSFASSLETLDMAIRPATEPECAARGVDGIRVQTYAPSGVEVDDRRFACAEPIGDGPVLVDGDYRVEISGVRRAGGDWSCVTTELPIEVCALRAACNDAGSGEQWCTCDGPSDCGPGLTCVPRTDIADACAPGAGDDAARTCMACAARRVHEISVVEGETLPIETVLLDPPQCDDGIDNDGDGLADALDPACARDPFAAEDADAADAVFALGVSFFDNSPAVDCFEAGIGSIRAEVYAIDPAVPMDPGTLVFDVDLPCERTIAPFSKAMEAGDYALRVTGLGSDLGPATVTHARGFLVSETEGAFVAESFDFDDDDFLTPLTGPIAFFTSYAFRPDVAARTGCAPGASSLSSLVIEELRVQVFDEDAAAVPTADVGIAGAVDEGGGVFRIPCPTTVVEGLDPLVWNKYSVSVEALVGGETCFATDEPQALGPRTPRSLVLERVRVDGAAVGACADCDVDADCSNGACVDGVCVPV